MASNIVRQDPRNGRQCPQRPLDDRGLDGHNERRPLKHGLNFGQRIAHTHHSGASTGGRVGRPGDSGTLMRRYFQILIGPTMPMRHMPWSIMCIHRPCFLSKPVQSTATPHLADQGIILAPHQLGQQGRVCVLIHVASISRIATHHILCRCQGKAGVMRCDRCNAPGM